MGQRLVAICDPGHGSGLPAKLPALDQAP